MCHPAGGATEGGRDSRAVAARDPVPDGRDEHFHVARLQQECQALRHARNHRRGGPRGVVVVLHTADFGVNVFSRVGHGGAIRHMRCVLYPCLAPTSPGATHVPHLFYQIKIHPLRSKVTGYRSW